MLLSRPQSLNQDRTINKEAIALASDLVITFHGAIDHSNSIIDPYKLLMKYKVLDFYIEDYIDRKSTRLNSSHVSISYAVFCLKKKKLKYFVKNRKRAPLKGKRREEEHQISQRWSKFLLEVYFVPSCR